MTIVILCIACVLLILCVIKYKDRSTAYYKEICRLRSRIEKVLTQDTQHIMALEEQIDKLELINRRLEAQVSNANRRAETIAKLAEHNLKRSVI